MAQHPPPRRPSRRGTHRRSPSPKRRVRGRCRPSRRPSPGKTPALGRKRTIMGNAGEGKGVYFSLTVSGCTKF